MQWCMFVVTPKVCNPLTFTSHECDLFQIDDMGFNDIGYTSNDLMYATETLNNMAENGVKLMRYYSASSCTPARVSFLTGRYPSSVKMGYDDRGAFVAVSPYGVPLNVKLLPKCVRHH